MNKPKYTAAQMADALRETKGTVYLAAKRLDCDVNTVLRYCKRYPSVEQAKQAARGEILDETELRLVAAIRRDEPWAIAFYLKTVGRHRGYGERLDLHLTIERAAARVATHFGLSVEEVLREAPLLLEEIDHES
jgi:hypothetical protein